MNKAHGKDANSINHQENAHYSPSTTIKRPKLKGPIIPVVGKNIKHLEFSYTVGRSIKQYTVWENYLAAMSQHFFS